MKSKTDQVTELSASYTTIRDAQGAAQTKLASAEELLQTLITGLANSQSTNNTTGGGYLGQIAQAKKRVIEAASEEEAARLRISMLEKELKDKDAKLKQLEKEGGEGQKALAIGKKEIEALKKGVAATGWSAEKDNEAKSSATQADSDAKRLTEVSRVSMISGYRPIRSQ